MPNRTPTLVYTSSDEKALIRRLSGRGSSSAFMRDLPAKYLHLLSILRKNHIDIPEDMDLLYSPSIQESEDGDG